VSVGVWVSKPGSVPAPASSRIIAVRVRKPRSTGLHILTVGVKDRAVHPVTTTGSGGRLQGVNDQASVVAVVHRPAEQVAGGQVDDRRQIQPASSVGM
jgi:hypothetical protein